MWCKWLAKVLDGRRTVEPSLTRTRRLRWIGLGLAWILLCAAPAVAAVPPAASPGVQDQTIEPERRPGRPDMTPREPARIDAPARPGRPAKEAEGPKVFVKKFRITGNTVISTKKLEALVRSEEGKELTLEQLRAVAANVTEYYGSQGYILARAYLPPQDVREGVIEIAVLEGNVGEVEVTGTERYEPDVIKRALTRVRNRGAVHEGLLETAINDLNEYPGLNVRASLRPGAERGKTDILMTAQERSPITGMLDINNYGSRYTGPWKYGFELGYGSVAGFGDKVTLRGIKSDDDLTFSRFHYQTPVGGYGTKLGFSFSHSENGIGEEFASLNASGQQSNWSVEINQPFLKTAGANFEAFGLFESIRSKQFVLKVPAGVDDLRVFRLGFTGDLRDRFLGRWYYGLTYHQGLRWLGGSKKDDPGATRPDGPGDFAKLSLDLARLQSLVYGGSYLVLRGSGQLSNQNLLTPEKYVIGGYYTVRGYPMAEQTGDQGYVVSAELVVPVPWLREWVRLAGFIDHGGVFNVSRNKGAGEIDHWLTGVGGGLRFDLPIPTPYFGTSTVQIRVDYAKPILGPKPSSFKSGVTQGEPGVLYISAAYRF